MARRIITERDMIDLDSKHDKRNIITPAGQSQMPGSTCSGRFKTRLLNTGRIVPPVR